MAGDFEAAKNGSMPQAAPITIALPIKTDSTQETQDLNTVKTEPIKDSGSETTRPDAGSGKKQTPQETTSPDTRSGQRQAMMPPMKLAFPKINPPAPPKNNVLIRPSPVPRASEIQPSDKSLTPPKPLTPSRPQPFSSPINKPLKYADLRGSNADLRGKSMEPQQQKIAPPPGLPVMPPQPPTQFPTRPLTPPPPPRPPLQNMPEMQKLPPLPQRPLMSLPPVPPTSGLPQTPIGRAGKRKLVSIIIISIVILAFIAGEIWWFFLRPTSPTVTETTQNILPAPQEVQPLLPANIVPTTPTAPEITAPELPSSLLSYARTETVNLEDILEAAQMAGADEIVRLAAMTPIATSDEPTADSGNAAKEYADLADAISTLKIKIPASVKNGFTGDFDLFAFGGNEFDREECARVNNTAANCYGPRLGLAIAVSDPAKTLSALKIWEKTMASDLKPMILAKPGASSSVNFLTGTYGGKTIRYKNMPINTMTVEYTLANDILIITTSKSAALKAIDLLPTVGDTDEDEP